MSIDNLLEDAVKKMSELVRSDIVTKLNGANEAKTRLLIIDEVLNILGWPKSEYEPEQATTVGSYTDYRLTIDGQPRLIVEAKRVGTFNPLPKTIQNPQYANSFLYNNYGPEMKSLLEQCLGYCTQCGIPYAIATTGEVWIVLHGFKYGVEWGKLRSFVFHSLDDILKRFGNFYGLISREAVKNNSLEEQFGGMVIIKPRVAIRPREAISQSADIGQPPPNKQLIRAFFDYFMGDITRPGKEKMLQQCYVDNQELNEFSRELQQILQYDALFEESDFSSEDANQQTLEKELEIQSESGNPKTILLVGHVGAGKSTFVHRFVRHDRPKQHICTIVDLINHATKDITRDRAEEQRLADLVLNNLAPEFQKKLDPYSPAVLRGCFEDKIGRFKKQRQILFRQNPENYALEEEKYIFELSADKYQHLVGYIKFARKKGLKVWIAFDNVDRGSESYQQFVYSFAHQLGSDARCVTLITLRQDTFLEAQDAGFLDVRSTDIVFQLSAPEFRQIISKRRRYINKIVENNELPSLFKSNDQLIRLLSWHLNRLALVEDDFIRLFITTFSLNNIRYGFAMLRDYYISPHSTFHEFYQLHQDNINFNQTINLNYYLEHSRFLQALMLGNSWNYDEKRSDIFNIFSVDLFEKVSHFIMLRILAYLSLKLNSTSSRHSIKYEQLYNDFILLGYPIHHINNAVIKLLYAGLVVSPSLPAIPIIEEKVEILDPLPKDTKIALSAKGYYYLRRLVYHAYYQTRVGEDTVWYNEDLAQQYIKCVQDATETQGNGLDDTLQATEAKEIFISYLKWSLLDEVQNSNILQTAKEWAQVMNNIVEKSVFGKNIIIPDNNDKNNSTSEEVNDLLNTFYSSFLANRKRNIGEIIPEQLSLFEEDTTDYRQAIQEAIMSLGTLAEELKTDKNSRSYGIRILWALEIAFRVGLGPLQPRDIVKILHIYGGEQITVRSIIYFLRNQKRHNGEYNHLWREEPQGFYTINSFGQNMLFSQMNIS